MDEVARRAGPSHDVVVVGGGPAGAAAATVLARGGHDVLVVDRARFPRDKTCGDGLTTWALRELEQLGFDPGSVPSFTPVDRVHLSTPGRHRVTYGLPPGPGLFAAVARRRELDASVLQLARDAGATVLEESRALDALQLGDRVRVTLEGTGAVEARWLIGADGMWSPTRRWLGTSSPGNRGEWHALRQYMADVSPAAGRELFVWFEPDILPGYVWSFPVAGTGNGANVGFGIRRDGHWRVGAMGALWPEILRRPQIRAVLGPDARPEGAPRAWPIPARVDRLPTGAGRALWVGDALAATDPMTGEGIGQALASGRWAAEAIATGEEPHLVRHRYGEAVRRGLSTDHGFAELLSRALSHRRGARFAIWLTARTPWTRAQFARWLFEDEPRAVALTPHRWHGRLLQRPGAYAGTTHAGTAHAGTAHAGTAHAGPQTSPASGARRARAEVTRSGRAGRDPTGGDPTSPTAPTP